MDRVRLGRALGYGTRHAAKTVAAVVEAATAPDTSAKAASAPHVPGGGHAGAAAFRPEISPSRGADPSPQSTPARPQPASRGSVGLGLRRFRQSVWGPLALFSGALWLRVTGLFFALIASTMGSGAWRLRALPGAPAAGFHPMPRFWIFVVFTALFGYFAVSSFLRASLKERRAAKS